MFCDLKKFILFYLSKRYDIGNVLLSSQTSVAFFFSQKLCQKKINIYQKKN